LEVIKLIKLIIIAHVTPQEGFVGTIYYENIFYSRISQLITEVI